MSDDDDRNRMMRDLVDVLLPQLDFKQVKTLHTSAAGMVVRRSTPKPTKKRVRKADKGNE